MKTTASHHMNRRASKLAQSPSTRAHLVEVLSHPKTPQRGLMDSHQVILPEINFMKVSQLHHPGEGWIDGPQMFEEGKSKLGLEVKEEQELPIAESKISKTLQHQNEDDGQSPIIKVADHNGDSIEIDQLEIIKHIQEDNNFIGSEDDYTVFKVHGRIRKYDKHALFCLSGDSKLRFAIVWLINWKWFEYLIMACILLNSITIAAYDFSDVNDLTERNRILQKIQLSIQVVYLIELVLNVLGMGLIHRKNSFLRDGWNIIDTIVISLGLGDIISNVTTLKSLRVLRILQPLRTITRWDRLRQLVNTLLRALPDFGNVSIFMVILFILFGIFGIQLHSDSFYWRCRLSPTPEYLNNTEDNSTTLVWLKDPAQSDKICSMDYFGIYKCLEGTYCGSPYQFNLGGATFDNVLDDTFINYGVLTFDNLWKAVLTIFQIITNDNWALTMYNLMNVTNPVFAAIFMVLIVIVLSFFIINIILAVILDSFINVQQEDLKKKFIMDYLATLAGMQYVEDQFNNKVEEAELDCKAAHQSSLEQEVEAEEDKPAPFDQHTGNLTSKQLKEKRRRELDPRIKDGEKEVKDYIKDQMKQDIDYLKTVIISKDNVGSISRLRALQRAITLVDSKVEANKKAFKEVFLYLKSIAKHKKRNRLYSLAYEICQSNLYCFYFIPTIITLNTGILALDRYPMSDQEQDNLETINLAFFFIFFSEVLLKMIALGFHSFFFDNFNIFDSILVLIGCIDTVIKLILLSQPQDQSVSTNNSGSLSGVLSAVRAFRLLRIFKLATTWKKFKDLLLTVWKTLKDISTFTIFISLFVFIYALLGMEIFSYRCKKTPDDKIDLVNGKSPLNNFDTFYEALLTIFVLLTGDQWTSIMLDYYRAVSQPLALVFFVTFMIFGQYMLLNLFLAILLQNFDEDSIDQEMQKKLMIKKEIERQLRIQRMKKYFKAQVRRVCPCLQKKARIGMISDNRNLEFDDIKYVDQQKSKRKAKTFLKNLKGNQAIEIKAEFMQMSGKSLEIFSVDNSFRRFVYRVITSHVFDNIILVVILVSTVQLALENPLNDPEGNLSKSLVLIDIVTTIIFGVEMVLKIVAFGLLFSGENAYLRNPTNLLDFFITSLSVLSIVIENFDVSIIKVFRLFKILRPLRFITRIQAFNIAVRALSNAIFNVVSVLVISMLFFMIFGILGVNYFKGHFSYCKLDHTSWMEVREDGSVFTKWSCFSYGGEWETKMQNFDNIINAMMTLFQMATLSDWLNVMYDGMSITGVDSDFILKSRPYTAIFFVLFVIVGAFFTLNLFVGVVISTYNREKEKIAKDFLLKERQKEWLYAKQVIFRQNLQPLIISHKNKYRNWMLSIYKSPQFNRVVMGAIVLNTVVLAVKYVGEPRWVSVTTEVLNYLFTAFFTLEAIVKLCALGQQSFEAGWNRFDFLVIAFTYVFIVIDSVTSVNLGAQVTLLRSFRILRIFKYFKATKSLKVMFNTFIVTLPAVGSIGGLLGLLIYVYAVLGVNLFAEVKQVTPLDSVQTFQGFGQAYLILIKIATGDGWAEIMNIMSLQESVLNQCLENPSYQDYIVNQQTVGCGSFKASTAYFYSYLIIVKLVFLNLFIAVILEGFDTMNIQESRALNSDVLEAFRELWQISDPDATGFIAKQQLPGLLTALGFPLGFVPDDSTGVLTETYTSDFLASLRLPSYHSFKDYFYVDVILALCKRVIVLQEIDQGMKSNPKGSREVFRLQILKELKDLDKNEEMIDSVQKMKKEEKRFKRQAMSEEDRKSGAFTQMHEEAARKLIQHLRNFVRRKKLEKGAQVHRYTREELEEIDRRLMDKFKLMAGCNTDELSVKNVKDGVPEILKISIASKEGSQQASEQEQLQSSNSSIMRAESNDQNFSIKNSQETSMASIQQHIMSQQQQPIIIEDDSSEEQKDQEVTDDFESTSRPFIIPEFKLILDYSQNEEDSLSDLNKDIVIHESKIK